MNLLVFIFLVDGNDFGACKVRLTSRVKSQSNFHAPQTNIRLFLTFDLIGDQLLIQSLANIGQLFKNTKS